MVDKNYGSVSEWNEGTFKSVRLHEAQILINNSKIDVFRRNGNKWNYELWFEGINILFCEGYSKYSSKEYEDNKKLKKEIEEFILKNKICINGRSVKGIVISINEENWKILKNKLEEFEYSVKFCNDKHGLSTRNVGTKGLF